MGEVDLLIRNCCSRFFNAVCVGRSIAFPVCVRVATQSARSPQTVCEKHSWLMDGVTSVDYSFGRKKKLLNLCPQNPITAGHTLSERGEPPAALGEDIGDRSLP